MGVYKASFNNGVFCSAEEGRFDTTIVYRRCPVAERTLSKLNRRILLASYLNNAIHSAEHGYVSTLNRGAYTNGLTTQVRNAWMRICKNKQTLPNNNAK